MDFNAFDLVKDELLTDFVDDSPENHWIGEAQQNELKTIISKIQPVHCCVYGM